MLAGVLELQLFAEMARLTTDMKRAERVVQDSTDRMGRSVAGLESAFGKLGSTLSLGIAFDQIRRMSDDFVKLTAQLRIATKSQQEYAQGLADVRRISTAAQADINATTMLYSRLTNALGQHGATQKQIATITESVSLGLKAYGATATEAASAMLQLSQAFGANRLGGEEFRAVSESMPNMMKVLAQSMNVPYEALKKLSAEGKITAEVMMKAWDNPALIEALRKQADQTRTITGELTIFRNNLKMLVGQLMETSDGTRTISGGIQMMSESLKFLEQNLTTVIQLLTAYVGYLALMGAKAVIAWVQARLVAMAHTQALVADAIGAAAHARAVVLAEAQEAAAIQLKTFAEQEAFIATRAATQAALAGTLAAEERTAMELRLAGSINAVNIAHAEAIAIDRERTAVLFAGTAAEGARTAALAASSAGAIRWGTSVSAAVAMIGTSVSAAVLANPIGLAIAAILAIGVAIVNWETIVKASKATFDWFGNMLDSLVWGAHAVAAGIKEVAGMMALENAVKNGTISLETFRKMSAELKADTEKAKLDQAKLQLGIGQDARTYDEKQAAERIAANRDAWEKLTNTKEQQRKAELAALAEQYAQVIKDDRGNKALLIEDAIRYKNEVAQINEKYGKAALKAESKAAKELADLVKANQDAELAAIVKVQDAGQAKIKSIEDEIAKQKQHNLEIGMTAEQIAILRAQEVDLKIAVMEKQAVELAEFADVNTGIAEKLRLLNIQIEKEKELRSVKAAAAPLEAIKAEEKAKHDALVKQDAENKKVWEHVDGYAKSAFMNITSKGKNAFAEIGQAIKSSILDMLYQMTIHKWIFQIGGVGLGTAAAGSAAADVLGGGSSGTGGLLQAGQTLWSGFSGSMAQGGAALANAMGFTNFGAGMAGQAISGTFANAAAMDAAASTAAMGAQFAAVMPYAAVAAVAIPLIAGLFGGSNDPAYNTGNSRRTFSRTGNVLTAATDNPMGNNAAADAFVQGMQSSYMKAAMSLGIGVSATNFALGGNADSKSANFVLSGGVGTSASYQSAFQAKTDAAMQLEASRAVFAALKGSELPGFLAKMFDGLTVGAMSQQQITDTLAFAGSVKQMRDALLETRAPLEILRANVRAGTEAFKTSAATFKTDFVAAIDAGINPTTFEQWKALGTAIDQLAAADAQAATANLQATTQAVADARKALMDAGQFAYQTGLNQLQAAKDMVSASFASLTLAVDKERKAITEAYTASVTAVRSQIDGIKASVSDLRTLSGLLHSSLSGMGIVPSRASSQAQIAGALLTAQSGGGLPSSASLQAALTEVAKPSQALFGNFVDYQRDFIRTANDIAALGAIADTQLSTADTQVLLLEQQLKVMEVTHNDQLSRLDAIVATAQAQIDAVNGTTVAVLSIAAAVGGVNKAVSTQRATAPHAQFSAADFSMLQSMPNQQQAQQQAYDMVVANNWDLYAIGAAGGHTAAEVDKWAFDNKIQRLPGFAVGTNSVPFDMKANIHAGEEITPRPYVDMQRGARMETNALLARLVASNDASRTELVSVRRELADIRRTNQNIDWVLDKFDNEGMPEVRLA